MSESKVNIHGRGIAAALVAAGLAVGGLAGCGGSGSATATEAGAIVSGGSSKIVASRDEVAKNDGATEIVTGRFPTGRDTDEVSTSGTKPIRPCVLVTGKEATAILGGSVRKEEHPQGPTCVFTGSGREITMAITELPLQPLVSGARKSTSLTVRGHRAYCIRYETSSVVTAIGNGKVLQVTGPCQAAVRFVSAALPRIPH
jgi:hypothetical protein